MEGIRSQKCFSGMEENRKNEKKTFFRKKNFVCQVSFDEKKLNTRCLLHFSQTMACRNLFCCWKNQQKWEYKEETSREHKQRVTQKEEIAFPISFRKRYVLEKMLQKKESKGEKRATQISLNMQSGSSQSFVQRQINMKSAQQKGK